ncbi:MAG: carboxypeptidase-like regulatory domain-containing protein, partial [Mameliella sp.]|nr:carboxypeptidase-like regulatory domain-containing protein [Phaeodactylibacter sp.]
MKKLSKYFLLLLLLLPLMVWAQAGEPAGFLIGQVVDQDSERPVSGASVILPDLNLDTVTDEKGQFKLKDIPLGKYKLVVFAMGKSTWENVIEIDQSKLVLEIQLSELAVDLDAIEIQAKREKTFGITSLRAVEGTAIYEGRKSEVVVLEDILANLSTNNPRQVFARVTGLNIWESDGAGLQLGIGGRGLSPNRTSNFNTRQNGYDISADALGYPESYYTPPAEALKRIEVVRGAASLQYGTQFGGMVNFVFKDPPKDKPIELVSRQTVGAFNFFGSFNSIAGTVADGKFSYYAFYNRRQGDGWRPNAGFTLDNGFAALNFQPNDQLKIGFEATIMGYLAQQPGGLTDAFFEQDPRQSIRSRNWFSVNWNLFALTLDYQFSDRTKLNIRNFGLMARRQSLGALNPIN